MVMACIHGSTAIGMKASSSSASSMVRVCNVSPTETSTRVYIRMASPTASDNTTGSTAVISKAHSGMVSVVVRASGRKALVTVTSTKGSTLMTRNQGTGYSHGRVGMCIKGSIRMIRGMAGGRCTGRMAAFTGGSGRMGFSMAGVRFIFPGRGWRGACFRIIHWWRSWKWGRLGTGWWEACSITKSLSIIRSHMSRNRSIIMLITRTQRHGKHSGAVHILQTQTRKPKPVQQATTRHVYLS